MKEKRKEGMLVLNLGTDSLSLGIVQCKAQGLKNYWRVRFEVPIPIAIEERLLWPLIQLPKEDWTLDPMIAFQKHTNLILRKLIHQVIEYRKALESLKENAEALLRMLRSI